MLLSEIRPMNDDERKASLQRDEANRVKEKVMTTEEMNEVQNAAMDTFTCIQADYMSEYGNDHIGHLDFTEKQEEAYFTLMYKSLDVGYEHAGKDGVSLDM